MSFNPNLPANHTPIVASELRNQFNGLKAFVEAVPAGPAGAAPPQGIAGPSLGAVPIGSVVSWLKSFPNVPVLPNEFVECNGQVLSDAGSPFNGQTIPDLNGASGPQCFLRGASASGGTGGADTHSHTIDLSAGANDFDAGASAYGAAPDNFNTSDASSLPSYYEVV